MQRRGEVVSDALRQRDAMSNDLSVTVKRWRDGSWSAAAMGRAGQGTLIECDGRGAARVLVVDAVQGVEATTQPVLYPQGLGRVTAALRVDRAGMRRAHARRIFPNGTVRVDAVRRQGADGERRSQWFFPNGSRAVARATPRSQTIELFHRSGRLVQSRVTTMQADHGATLTFRTTVGDGGGAEIGATEGALHFSAGRQTRVVVARGGAHPTRSSMQAWQAAGGPLQRSVATVGADGTTVFQASIAPDGASSSWATIGEDGSLRASGRAAATASEGGSACTGRASYGGAGHTTGGHTWESQSRYQCDGDFWTGTTTTTKDGDTALQSSHAEDSDGNVTDVFVSFNEDGSGAVVIVSKDAAGHATTIVSGFDADGNPVDPPGESGGDSGSGTSGGGDSGGGDQGGGGPDGSPPEPAGGGDGSTPSDCGTDEGPRSGGSLGGVGGLGFLGGLGDVGAPRAGGGDPAEDPGDGFEDARQSLASQIRGGGVGSGGHRSDGGWGDSGADESPPLLRFVGSPSLVAAPSATDDWGDLVDPRALSGFMAAVFGAQGKAAVARAVEAAAQVQS